MANPITREIDAMDIDIKLTNTEGLIENGVFVWMYASLQNKLDYSRFESAACLVKFTSP